ncbi:CdiA family toxin C-terminal domain-containing protein [Enterococcus larvae]|nr:CdiA family toxin C-terminal domain-containing protein [Enterococcus larvae]
MGLNALEYGAVKGRYVQGIAPNGLRYTGFLDETGTLTNFFPTMK